MCRILKGHSVGERRSLSIENPVGLKATVDFSHQADEWIDQSAVAPQNTRNMLDHIKCGEIVDRALGKWKTINTQPATKIVWLVKL